MYKKLPCLSSFSPQLYETKLISLLYFRAFHDDTIEYFQIAANLDNIRHFDDICLKFKVDGLDKPIAVFIRARHSENKKHIYKIDLCPCFTSYLKLREHFKPNNKDLFFKGTFDETECFFVLYTNARDEFNDDSNVITGVCSMLNDLIGTGGTAKQPYKQEEHEQLKFLCEVAMKEQMTLLAERIAKFINADGRVEMLLTDEIVLRYHVILARKVFDVSEIQPDGYRIASFRHDFFDTCEEYLIIFKDTLFKELLKKRTILPGDIKRLLSEFSTKPTDVLILSELIETVITYKNGFLEINRRYTEYFRPELKQVYLSQQTVDKAIEIAAKKILLSLKRRVPSAFGNKDLTIRGNKETKEKRVNYITTKIINLLNEYKSSKMVTVDESLEDGFLRLNGGIAGAIGNIFVLDDNTKLMKVTDNCKQLGPLAKSLYTKLNSEIDNLHEYKFNFIANKFPKISLDYSSYEENLARDFLKRILFFSNQADHYGVENILKKEIADNQRDKSNYAQAKTDVIFLKLHDQIMKWWMLPEFTPYLTKTSHIMQVSMKASFQNTLMHFLNIMYMTKMKEYNYTVTENAVRSLNLPHHSSIIITEISELTVVKVLQHLEIKYHVVLDFEHIANLPTNVCELLCKEILNTEENLVLILVYNKTNSRQDLEKISKAVRRKRNIVVTLVTNQTSFEIIQEYFPKVENVIQDKKLCLTDLSEQSQMSVLEDATVVFPGVEIKLALLLKDWAKTGSRFPCVTAPRALQQSDDEDTSTSQGRTVGATAAAANDEKGPGSRSTEKEEKILPGTSSDPVSTP